MFRNSEKLQTRLTIPTDHSTRIPRAFFCRNNFQNALPTAGIALGSLVFGSISVAAPADYFRINVVDAETGRGVPLVELVITNDVRYVTDSNGIAAVNDPELMGQKVYFSVKSHGYHYPKDMFGNSGTAFDVAAGGQGIIKIKRQNIAERLYRITGAGIYRDSVLVGAKVPIQKPLLNGLVMGQDTVHATPYQGKIFWLWGDTSRLSYPLGNFFTSAATSLLPTQGGLSPDQGVDLTYWVDEEGFSKKMMPLGGNKPVWMGALFTLPDDKGRERLFGAYSQVESDSKSLESGLAVFNDDKAVFEKVGAYTSTLRPDGRPFKATVNGKTYLYWHPFMRTLADYAHVTNPLSYEAYTCAMPGATEKGADTPLERDAQGNLVYGWKADTVLIRDEQEQTLIAAKKMAPTEALTQLRDIESGEKIAPKGGSVFWNPYRKRWVRIVGQGFGKSSVLGEIYFCEADSPTGPYVYARKIVTHDAYSFYNTTQHPFFDQQGGRLIYFEGTYTSTYSGQKERTPRYDYNQIMYRLALDDPRLMLPVPIYALKNDTLAPRTAIDDKNWPSSVQNLPFFAMPSAGDAQSGLIPVYAFSASPRRQTRLQLTAPAGTRALFYALPAGALEAAGQKPDPNEVALYEITDIRSGACSYGVEGSALGEGQTRAAWPLARVWRNPASVLTLDDAIAPNN